MLKLGIDPEKLYQTTFTAYVVAIWPLFLFDSFVKIWNTCENFLGKWLTAPPGKKFPVRLWVYDLRRVLVRVDLTN